MAVAALLMALASSAVAREYKVKPGDTLSKIAAAELGGAERWQEIAELNHIQQPESIKVGQTLQLPDADRRDGPGHTATSLPAFSASQTPTPLFIGFLAWMTIGGLVALIGFFVFLVGVFKEGPAWGIACLLCWISWPIFLILHWDKGRKGFFIMLLGLAMCIVGVVVSITTQIAKA